MSLGDLYKSVNGLKKNMTKKKMLNYSKTDIWC